jgi:hypothetical protein
VRKEFRERQAGVRQIETESGVLQGRDGVSRGKRTIAGGVHVLSLVEHSKVRVLSKRKYLCEHERIQCMCEHENPHLLFTCAPDKRATTHLLSVNWRGLTEALDSKIAKEFVLRRAQG